MTLSCDAAITAGGIGGLTLASPDPVSESLGQRRVAARESVVYHAVVRIFGVKLGAAGPDHPVWVTGAAGIHRV